MPELPLMRTSERTCFKSCRQKWWWGYVDCLKARRSRPALSLGTLVHAALALRYPPGLRRGPHPAKSFSKLYAVALDEGMDPIVIKEDDTGARLSGLDLGIAMLEGYVEEYGTDDRYRVISPEQTFQLVINNPRTGRPMFIYVSTIDAVVQDLNNDKLGYFEYKTTSTGEPFGAPLSMDEQANSYWTFGTEWLHEKGILKPNQDLDFMLYRFLRKVMPDSRPEDDQGRKLNQNGTISKRQPPPRFKQELVMRGEAERQIVMKRTLNEFREMQMVKQGKLAVYKAPDRHCLWCEFKDMCEVHETGSDWEALRDETFKKWNPYEEHEEAMALELARKVGK